MYPNRRARFEGLTGKGAAIGTSNTTRAVLGGLFCVLVLNPGGSAAGQMAGHGAHPPMPDQNFALSCSVGETEPNTTTVALDLANPAAPATLEQMVELPQGWPALRVTHFLPQADLRQVVTADTKGRGKPAIQLSITGPTQSFERWLIADDMRRNRLASYIGTWRFMAVAKRSQRKELFKEFEHELTREPRLLIRYTDADKADKVEELPAVAGKTVRLEHFDASIRVIRFYPHFGVDQGTKKPVNQSEKRSNPAALVEIEINGSKREEWIFSRFPEYRQHPNDPLPFGLTLDCPSAGERSVPDFLIVATNRSKLHLAVRADGKTSSRSLGVGDSVEIAGSQYRFSVSSMHPSGQLTEVYEPSKGKGGTPALRLEASGDSKSVTPIWLELGKPKIVLTSNGSITLTLHLDKRQGERGHP